MAGGDLDTTFQVPLGPAPAALLTPSGWSQPIGLSPLEGHMEFLDLSAVRMVTTVSGLRGEAENTSLGSEIMGSGHCCIPHG